MCGHMQADVVHFQVKYHKKLVLTSPAGKILGVSSQLCQVLVTQFRYVSNPSQRMERIVTFVADAELAIADLHKNGVGNGFEHFKPE